MKNKSAGSLSRGKQLSSGSFYVPGLRSPEVFFQPRLFNLEWAGKNQQLCSDGANRKKAFYSAQWQPEKSKLAWFWKSTSTWVVGGAKTSAAVAVNAPRKFIEA